MDDDVLLAFLGSLPRMGMGVSAGYVGIARSVVQEADGDLAAVMMSRLCALLGRPGA
jgi:hypothetical protein